MLRRGRAVLWKPAACASRRCRRLVHGRPADDDEDGPAVKPPPDPPPPPPSDAPLLSYAPLPSAAPQPPPPPPPGQHSDLASFLEYARRTGLNDKSTIYVGTHYEYTVAAALAKRGFSLRRIGGASDGGTDLVGTWVLPAFPQPLKVIVQCKAGVQRVGPHRVRELEGAFAGAPVGWRGRGVLAVLATERPATRGVRESLNRSRWPMAYLCCSAGGALSQMLWNRRAEQEGLEGMGVAVWHRPHDGQQVPQLVLTRHGVAVRPIDDKSVDASERS